MYHNSLASYSLFGFRVSQGYDTLSFIDTLGLISMDVGVRWTQHRATYSRSELCIWIAVYQRPLEVTKKALKRLNEVDKVKSSESRTSPPQQSKRNQPKIRLRAQGVQVTRLTREWFNHSQTLAMSPQGLGWRYSSGIFTLKLHFREWGTKDSSLAARL